MVNDLVKVGGVNIEAAVGAFSARIYGVLSRYSILLRIYNWVAMLFGYRQEEKLSWVTQKSVI